MANESPAPVSSTGVDSMIHLANVSAVYGNSIFSDVNDNEDQNTTQSANFGCCDEDESEEVAGSCSPCPDEMTGGKTRKKVCSKQHQLPMFLSKTYHMIDRADPTIATWSVSGDSFVVKHVEKFAASVLPQYFKHSNFSSFARQLNFYGFRKLKAEPILTADFDARTACYVRFYHEKFQKDRPELLQYIKRATKSDQQSKDDVESLKMEISNLKECISNLSQEYDRKLSDMSFNLNRKISSISSDYDKLNVLVQQMLAAKGEEFYHLQQRCVTQSCQLSKEAMMRSLSEVACMSLQTSPPLRPHQSTTQTSGPVVQAGEKRPAPENFADQKDPPTRRPGCDGLGRSHDDLR
eukprot:CAMPEP_0198303524 /NCGR_PEP_ID=MMETSP1449-20131203/56929_1 /TAXON_ID=420275 /ORGANISM="Attheya septentrionalis, Strain CCMP2084" /LENGTH=350 /DNA_ID=CAMNT_0044006019 /DNA_START=1031 /DNA_END=2083 /DNA_ORIENTATION=+